MGAAPAARALAQFLKHADTGVGWTPPVAAGARQGDERAPSVEQDRAGAPARSHDAP